MGTRFRSIAATVSHSLQVLVEASLGHVIRACGDFHQDGRFGEAPSASSMCFELPNPSAAPIVTYLLNYVGPSCDFEASLRKELWFYEDPLADLSGALRFWAEVTSCIDRLSDWYPDFSQQREFLDVPWKASTDLLLQKFHGLVSAEQECDCTEMTPAM